MDSSGGCPRFFNNCGESMQSKLDSPMPWIGMYVAAASAIMSLAMAFDAFHSFKSKRLWFPIKYSTLNAFILTVLAVSLKLPVDLTNQMLGVNEILARVSSLVLLSTVMGNLMTSLVTMEYNDIMLNLAALGTLVITIVVNVCIHVSGMLDSVGKEFRNTVTLEIYAEQIISTIFMFILFVMLCSCSIQVPSLRRIINKEYQRLHEKTSTEQVEWGKFTTDGVKTVVREYWVNARTMNPQFLVTRSEICATPGLMCLLIALTLLEAFIRMHFVYKGGVSVAASNYKWSINWILVIQSIGVALGTIAPVFRWFAAAKYKSMFIRESFKEELKLDSKWTEMLVHWRDIPLPLEIRHRKFREHINFGKRLVLNFCIGVQVVIGMANKIVLLISAACVKEIWLCFQRKKLLARIQKNRRGPLEWNELRKNVGNEVDKLIEIGKKKQPKNLIELLQKSVNFNGVKEFVGERITSPYDSTNCWSLSIVTLTSIAISLGNIPPYKSDRLLRGVITPDKLDQLFKGVTEGLFFVKLIEKSLVWNTKVESCMNAADDVWGGVQQFHKGQGINLKSESYMSALKELFDIADKTKKSESLLKVIAADSMYHITRTIIWSNRGNDSKIEGELFERISMMISDILSACLTNLVPLITFKCTSSAINEREKNVREAAYLFGQTQVILEMLQKRELPSLDPKRAAYMDEWRAFMKQASESPTASASVASTRSPQSNEEQVIEVEG